jgi:opacity protein-like surface antigen
MKKAVLIIASVFLVIYTSAQVEEFDEDAAGNGFGSIMMSFRSLDGSLAIFSGGGGGFIVKNIRIGVFYNGLTNSFSKNDTTSTSYKLGCSYGGIWLGYPIMKDNRLHGTAEMKFSIGNSRLIDTNWQQRDNGVFFGFTPSLGLEYSLTDVLRIAGGLEYHYSLFPETPLFYTSKSFSSPGVYISLRLGYF